MKTTINVALGCTPVTGMKIDDEIEKLGLKLPEPIKVPTGTSFLSDGSGYVVTEYSSPEILRRTQTGLPRILPAGS